MCLQELRCAGFLGVIVHCGTNDYDDGEDPITIVERAAAIVTYMLQSNRGTRVAIGRILPRPKDRADPDGGVAKAKRLGETNAMLKKMCKAKGVLFADCIGVVEKKYVLNTKMYSDDMLHLNEDGIERLGLYYQGLASSMMERK
jgi:lysophospholipase L1-like esterase